MKFRNETSVKFTIELDEADRFHIDESARRIEVRSLYVGGGFIRADGLQVLKTGEVGKQKLSSFLSLGDLPDSLRTAVQTARGLLEFAIGEKVAELSHVHGIQVQGINFR